jgi:GPN-loop GTPase
VPSLQARIKPHMNAQEYFLFDCPGQAELHMCHESFRSISDAMTRDWHLSLAAVQLVDSHLCTSPHKLLSALLMCLTSMLHLELPHVNVLSKVCTQICKALC